MIDSYGLEGYVARNAPGNKGAGSGDRNFQEGDQDNQDNGNASSRQVTIDRSVVGEPIGLPNGRYQVRFGFVFGNTTPDEGESDQYFVAIQRVVFTGPDGETQDNFEVLGLIAPGGTTFHVTGTSEAIKSLQRQWIVEKNERATKNVIPI